MKVMFVLLGTLCLLFLRVKSQGFLPPPNIIDSSLQHNLFQRQLTQSQQNHILSDIQQHQHRFTINQPNHRQHQQFTFQQQPSVELSLAQQQQQLQQQQQQQQLSNQRFPPPPPSPVGNPIRFPNNQVTPNNQQSQQSVIQHHTQTNFIPNFIQQVHQHHQQHQQQHGGLHQHHNTQYQRSPENQLQIPQQPFQQSNSVQQHQIQNLDFHRQNFLTLQNGPPQNQIAPSLPSQSFSPLQPQQSPFPPVDFQPIPPSFQQIPVVDGRVVGTPKPITTIFYQNPPNAQQQQQFQSFQTSQHIPNNFNLAPQISGGKIVQPSLAKDQIIQKHEAFVQKQYEKQQQKVKQLHQDFQQKQHILKQGAPTPSPQQLITPFSQQGQRSRNILPSEVSLFQNAVNAHELGNPRPSTSTASSTTAEHYKTTATEDPFNKLLQAQRKDIYAQLKLESATSKPTPPPQPKELDQNEILQQLQKALAGSPQASLGDKKFDATDIVLPNGQKVQVIRTSDPSLIKGGQELSPEIAAALQGNRNTIALKPSEGLKAIAPSKPQELVLPTGGKVQILPSPGDGGLEGLGGLSLGGLGGFSDQSLASEARIVSTGDGPPSFEELAAKGLIPEGYEIVQQPAPGSKPAASKPAAPPPPKKKPTFVYLEEQADGSFVIQGIKANGEKDAKKGGSELDSILERIQKGEIQLPPSVTRVKLPDGNELVLKSESSPSTPTSSFPKKTPPTPTTTTSTTTTTTTTTTRPYSTTTRPYITTTRPYITTTRPYITTTNSPDYTTLETTTKRRRLISSTLYVRPNPTTPSYRSSSSSRPRYSRPITTTTPRDTTLPPPSTERLAALSSTNIQSSILPEIPTTPIFTITTTSAPLPTAIFTERLAESTSRPSESSVSSELSQILKSHGLFAMSKYLKQSGLDNILNETGPYTVFVPTDKAFKNLLVQLGGPERAEEKFKANPRLLSGLLLHHVIPGAFDVSALQDEMTGVSLAGTQLRVNQYNMHDQEWNDVLITTINGAMIVDDKQDIKIPQGIAHGVDRVMFPLPVGDLLQTLQSDRERRFTTFLKILYASGMSDLLQNRGHKTYTIFAPTDKAFAEFDPIELDKLTSDRDAAQAFAMKYVMPGTLFSAGMRFYQVKDSLLPGNSITLQKTSNGKIKVNEAQMLTSNIPATNGVIHAIDGPI